MKKITRAIFLFCSILFCNAFASAYNGITQITVDQGFLTTGKGNTDHVLLRINLKRDIAMEVPVLSGLRISMNGTTNCNDISSIKVFATQSPFLNGDLLAKSEINERALFNEFYNFTFGMDFKVNF